MDEWVDIWTSDGRPTGEKALKSEAHRRGLFHPTIHLWIYNSKQEILLQQRSPQKNTFPGKWDVSVAGHITAGDTPLASAVRELEEELGVHTTEGNLELIAVERSEIQHSETLTDREFHHIYCLQLDLETYLFTLQHEEVSDIRWIPFEEFIHMQSKPDQHPDLIPINEAYLNQLFDHLRSKF